MESVARVDLGDEDPLLPVEPGYTNVLRVRTAIFGAMLVLAGLIVDRSVLEQIGFGWFLPLALLGIAVLAMGLYPRPFTDVMDTSVAELLKHVALSKLN